MSISIEVLDLPNYDTATDDEADQVVTPQPQTAVHPVQQPVRDPADIRTILSMSVACVVLVCLTLLMAGILA